MTAPMTNNRVFIIGPMTGYPDLNFPAFLACEHRLAKMGYSVMSLRKVVMEDLGGNTKLSNETYMRHALGWLVSVQQIAVLPGWMVSENAVTEFLVARALNLPVLNEFGVPENYSLYKGSLVLRK